MSNLTRETAFVPLLGSSNGLFLAITAVFFWFLHGAGAQRGPKHFTFHIIFVRKANFELAKYFLSHAVVKICPF